MIELVMDITVKIGLTGLLAFIVMIMADSFCKSAHEGETENKDIKYKTPVFIDAIGVASFYTMCGCIFVSILLAIWA